jgi:hypothetical protein
MLSDWQSDDSALRVGCAHRFLKLVVRDSPNVNSSAQTEIRHSPVQQRVRILVIEMTIGPFGVFGDCL